MRMYLHVYAYVYLCVCITMLLCVSMCMYLHDLMCILYVHVFACICMYQLTVTVLQWLYVCGWVTLSITCYRANEKGPFVLKFCFIFQRATAG